MPSVSGTSSSTPSAVDVFPAWGVASERGEWTGRWTEPDGVVQVRGTYLAQWRQVHGTWLIQAEVFVPTLARPLTPPVAMAPKPTAEELGRLAGVYVNQQE